MMDQVSEPILRGNLRSLIRISLPLMLFLFCEALTAFCERIFLSYHSIGAVHGSLNASYLATIFQSPCVAIGVMAQVFVGVYQGSGEYKRIGPCVWQLIWFAFLSFLVTFPLSFVASSLYFKGTVIQKVGIEYFTVLALGNFLFPLNAALSSFYLGRGKTLFVTTLMLASYVLHLFLSWLLVFGMRGVIPALGAQGAALAKCISLGMVCCIFFATFLTKKNREVYQTGYWQFSLSALWSYMRPGMVRAFGYLSSKLCWVAITYIIIKKGGRYLDVLTIGGTLIAFLVFIATGIYRAILTIASNLIGAQRHSEIWRLCRSCIVYIMGIVALLTIPLIFFSESLTYFFDFSSRETFRQTFRDINHWIWLYMFALTIQMGLSAFLVAMRDLRTQLYGYLFLWPISFIPVYFGLGLGGWQADKLWAIITLENIAFMLVFIVRLRQKNWEEKQLLSSSFK